MSYVNIAKAIAPIAKNIGDDVVRGMSKADDVAKTADDWGWKGGKPGEITGSKYFDTDSRNFEKRRALKDKIVKMERSGTESFNEDKLYKLYDKFDNMELKHMDQKDKMFSKFRKQLEDAAKKNNPVGKLYEKKVNKIKNLNLHSFTEEDEIKRILNKFVQRFYELEKAGIPREWTGKVLPALRPLGTSLIYNYDDAQAVSRIMKNMTNPQREKFLSILPQWEGRTIRELEENADKIIDSPYTDDIINMLPQWDGSIDDLIKAVELL